MSEEGFVTLICRKSVVLQGMSYAAGSAYRTSADDAQWLMLHAPGFFVVEKALDAPPHDKMVRTGEARKKEG